MRIIERESNFLLFRMVLGNSSSAKEGVSLSEQKAGKLLVFPQDNSKSTEDA